MFLEQSSPPPPLARWRGGSCRLNSDDTGLCEGADLNCSFTLLKQQADGLRLPALFFVTELGLSFQMASLSLLLPPGSRFPCVFSSSSPPFLPFSWAPLSSPVLPFPLVLLQSSLLLKISTALVRHCILITENIFSLESHCLQADEWGGENPSFKSSYTYTSLYSQRNSKGLFTTQLEGSLCKAALSEKHKLEY